MQFVKNWQEKWGWGKNRKTTKKVENEQKIRQKFFIYKKKM